jgi:hypothetical protein
VLASTSLESDAHSMLAADRRVAAQNEVGRNSGIGTSLVWRMVMELPFAKKTFGRGHWCHAELQT